MIPKINETEFVTENIVILKQPSYTHKMHIEEERVVDYIDGVEAYKQYIYKILNTEKELFPIYPNFGIKKRDLFGKSKQLAYIKLTRRIEDALLLDDRTKKVYNFEYLEEYSKDENLGMRFMVDTIFGTIEINEVINIEG